MTRFAFGSSSFGQTSSSDYPIATKKQTFKMWQIVYLTEIKQPTANVFFFIM